MSNTIVPQSWKTFSNFVVASEYEPNYVSRISKFEIYNGQKFFSFVDFTWSKELSDQWIFLKQNLCQKKPKVTRQ